MSSSWWATMWADMKIRLDIFSEPSRRGLQRRSRSAEPAAVIRGNSGSCVRLEGDLAEVAGLQDLPVAFELLGGPGDHDTAMGQHVGTVDDAQGKVDVLFDEHDRAAGVVSDVAHR